MPRLLVACVLASCCTPLMAQTNDNCANAIDLGTGPVVTFYDNNGATDDGIPIGANPLCTNWFTTPIHNDVWFRYTATTDLIEWSTCDPLATLDDTKVAVYEDNGICPPDNNQLVACDDDGCNTLDFQSQGTVFVTPGQQYLIRLGSFSAGFTGVGTLAIVPLKLYENDRTLYGHLNQRTLNPAINPARPANLGSYACGPVSLVNSMAYLERKYPAHYQRCLIPDTNGNGAIDPAEMNEVAVALSQPALMNAQAGGAAPANAYEPDEHGHYSGNPAGQAGGGVTFTNFAKGKDLYFAAAGKATLFNGHYPDGNPMDPCLPPWVAIGGVIDPMAIAFEVAEMCDVELGFRWQRRNPATGVWEDQMGGHFVTVDGFRYRDANGNCMWEPGEAVTHLKINDPWGPTAGPPPVENAPQAEGALSTVAGSTFLEYAGGAAGAAGNLRGRLQFWASECPILAPPQQEFSRGDCNGDGFFNIADAVFGLTELFANGPPAPCDDACDGNDDGTKNIADAVFALAALFSGGPSPAPPTPPACGPDPTSSDGLDCAFNSACP